MDKLVIEGGVSLNGQVSISGAKNAALPLMAASLLASGKHYLANVPRLRDIRTMQILLSNMGAVFEHGDQLEIDTSNIHNYEAPYEMVKTMRASVLVLGPLVARHRPGARFPARRVRHWCSPDQPAPERTTTDGRGHRA